VCVCVWVCVWNCLWQWSVALNRVYWYSLVLIKCPLLSRWPGPFDVGPILLCCCESEVAFSLTPSTACDRFRPQSHVVIGLWTSKLTALSTYQQRRRLTASRSTTSVRMPHSSSSWQSNHSENRPLNVTRVNEHRPNIKSHTALSNDLLLWSVHRRFPVDRCA